MTDIWTTFSSVRLQKHWFRSYVVQVSNEETKKVEVLNSNLVESLVIQKEEVMTVEESLKTTADSLKKQLKDEAHARTVLQVGDALC